MKKRSKNQKGGNLTVMIYYPSIHYHPHVTYYYLTHRPRSWSVLCNCLNWTMTTRTTCHCFFFFTVQVLYSGYKRTNNKLHFYSFLYSTTYTYAPSILPTFTYMRWNAGIQIPSIPILVFHLNMCTYVKFLLAALL